MTYCTCVCKFDEAEDNVIQWCLTHSLARDNAVRKEREMCAEEAEEWGEDHADSEVWDAESASEAIADVIRHQLPQ